MPVHFSELNKSIDTFASINPTPHIIDVTTIGPINCTRASFIPSNDGINNNAAPQNMRDNLSFILLPKVPASVIVSA